MNLELDMVFCTSKVLFHVSLMKTLFSVVSVSFLVFTQMTQLASGLKLNYNFLEELFLTPLLNEARPPSSTSIAVSIGKTHHYNYLFNAYCPCLARCKRANLLCLTHHCPLRAEHSAGDQQTVKQNGENLLQYERNQTQNCGGKLELDLLKQIQRIVTLL